MKAVFFRQVGQGRSIRRGERPGHGRRRGKVAIIAMLGAMALLFPGAGASRGTDSASCLPPPSGLVAWWPGDGDARDLGSKGFHGALLPGTAFAPGKVRSAFACGALGTGIRITNSASLRPTNLSVAAWIRSTGPDPYAYIVSKSYGATRASFALYATSSARLAFYVETSGPTGWARSGVAPVGLWDGRFHCVVGTYDNTRVRLYVDGEEIGTGEAASGAPRYRSDFFGGDLFLGTYEPNTKGEHPFRGEVDEVALWDRALTADEVRGLFAAGDAGMCRSTTEGCLPSPAGLTSWWSGDGHARDLAGGPEGRLNGAGYGPGIVGQAFRFGGDRGRVDFERDAPAGAFTIEAWVLYEGDAWGRLGNGWSTILEFGNDQPIFGVRDTGELNLWPTLQGGYVPLKQWTHVACTWDLVTSRLYVNGAQVAATNLAPATGGRGATLSYRTGDGPWLGMIDEVGIYERALTGNEIAAIHAAGSDGRCKPAVADGWTVDRLPSGLVSWWDAEGSAADVLGRNPGTLEGRVTYEPGRFGRAFRFHGAPDSVVVADSDSLDVSTQFTLEAWVKLATDTNDPNGPGRAILSKVGGPTGNVGYQWALDLAPTESGLMANFTEPGQAWIPGNWTRYRISPALPIGDWRHVAATYDANALVLYLDGRPLTTNVLGPRTIANSASRLRISGDDNGNAFFDGWIDDLRLYDRALAPGEIRYVASGVQEAPLILRQPANQVALSDVSFSVEALGREPMAYQWFHDGQPVAGATSATWTLPFAAITRASGGNYRVAVSNAFGVAESTSATLVVPPDLAVASLETTVAAVAGQPLVIRWTVANSGAGPTVGSWRVQISLADDARGTGAVPLRTLVHPNVLEPGATLPGSASVVLPVRASGGGWIVVRVDPDEAITEPDEANNARVASAPTAIDAPDLSPTGLSVPALVRPGQLVTLAWSVTNRGLAVATAPWTESVLVSNALGGARSLGALRATNTLASGAAESRTLDVAFPADGEAGDLAWWIDVDTRHEVPEESETNNRVAAPLPSSVPRVLVLGLPSVPVREDGGAATGTVARNGSRAEPLAVALSSSEPAELAVPGSVIIPAGQATAMFAIEPRRDGRLDGARDVAIGATAPGYEAATGTVRVLDVDVPRLSLAFAGDVVTEGSVLRGTVDLGIAAAWETVVALAGSHPDRLRVPATVVVPANTRSVVFDAEAPNDRLHQASASVTVSATVAGTSPVAAAVEVRDNDTPRVILRLAERIIGEGDGPTATTATLTRDPVTPYAVTVELASTNPAAARVPSRVVIPAGQAMTAFPVAAVDDAAAAGTREARLIGYVLAFGSEERLAAIEPDGLQVTDDDGPTLTLSVSPGLVREGGTAATVTVTRNGPTESPLTVRLSSGDVSEATLPESVTIASGADRASALVTPISDGTPDGHRTVTLGASAPGYADGMATLTVTDLDLPDLTVPSVTAPATTETDGYVEVSYRVANAGFAATPTNFLTRIYLSRDDVFGDDVLVGQHRFPGVLPPGLYFEQSLPMRVPSAAGEYRILVETDAEGAVGEALEDNNVGASAAPIRAEAAYVATVQASVDRVLAGMPVSLSGRATNRLGAPAPYKLVNVHVRVRRTERVMSALTDAEGRFGLVFEPLPREAGFYEVFATHPGVAEVPVQDTFGILGLDAEPAAVSVRIVEGTSASGTVTLTNPGEASLSGLAAVLEGLPAGVTGTVRMPVERLAGGERTDLAYALSASMAASGGRLGIRVTSAEGVILVVPVEAAMESSRPRLEANPGELVAGMARGRQTLVEVEVSNRGGAPAGPVTVSLPPASWMRLATPESLPGLAPGEAHRIALRLAPPVDLPVGDYSGVLVIDTDEAALHVPFRIRCLSEAKGNLRVEAEDEFTYFAEGSPRVAGARVIVQDAVSRETVREGITGSDGVYEAPDLPEGYYLVEVGAPDHDGFEATRLVLAGQTHAVTAFLRRQTVRYRWSVVPTEIEDRTRIVIETVFEASVPAPVVTVEPASIDLGALTGDVAQVDLKVTNHGLIAAEDTRLELPTDPDWRFTALVNDLGTLPARSSLTIPVIVERVRDGGRRSLASPTPSVPGDCVKAGTVCGQYWCGRWIRFCQPVVLQRLHAGCGSSGTMRFPELKFRGDWTPTQSGTVNVAGTGGGGWYVPPNLVASPSTCQECIKVFATVLTECSPEQIAQHDAGWYLVYHLACQGEAPPGFGVDDVMPAVFSQMQKNCPPDDDPWLPPDLDCFTLALVCPGWATDGAAAGTDWNQAGAGGPRLSSRTKASPSHPVQALAERAGRATLVDQVPPALARQMPLASVLAERLDRLEAVTGVLRVILGDEAWIAGAPGAQFPAWMARFTASLAPDSDAGARVSAAEQRQLLDPPPGPGLSRDLIDRLVARCNRTADYNASGIFDPAQVPPGQSLDFIGREAFVGAVRLAGDAVRASRAEGFANVVDAANAAHAELMAALDGQRGGGVCAQVRLRIEQEAVLTRDAFRATLEVENGVDVPLQDVAVDLAIHDASGADAAGRFGVRRPELENLTAVDGTGTIGARATGRAIWTLVPGLDAAPDAPVEHAVSGTLRYTQEGLRVTVPLAPVAITVHPNPRLFVKYFHQRDVFADDPYTDTIEPSIPYSLAVMIENRGHGDARHVRLVSSQPRIVENEKGLLADFRILATEVAGRNLVPTLTADFGAITNGQIAIGRWLLESTLQGLFVEYSATFEHLDGLGNPRLSLVEEVTIHEMLQLVRAGGAFDDGRPDFLVNDVPDAGDLPDTLYLSDGRTNRVAVVESGSFDAAPSANRRVVQLVSALPPGWAYLRIPDPGAGRFVLRRVTRSDGVEVPVGTNAWTTDRTFPGLGRQPLREHRLHLLDHDSPGRYTLEYGELEATDRRAPESRVAPLSPESPTQFRVAWSGDDEAGGSGLASFDLFVSVDGGAFVPWLERTTQRSAVFAGQAGSRYAFQSLATDRAGNREDPPPEPDAATRASRVNRPPEFAGPFEVAVDEGQRIDLLLGAVDPDAGTGAGSLTYRAGPGMPPGATLDAATGRFRWTTHEANGPGTNRFTLIATDPGLPPLSTTGQVRIVVREVNVPPVLAPIADTSIAEGTTLVIACAATDSDLPANTLRYLLARGAPGGATIDPVTGVFRWTPSEYQGPSTHRIEVIVGDDGEPPASDRRAFVVQVRDTRPDFILELGRTNLLAGETASVPIRLNTGLDLTRVRFTLDVAPGQLGDLSLQSLTPEIGSATLRALTPGRSEVELVLDTDHWVPGARELGRLRCTTRPGQRSAVVVLEVSGLLANRSGDAVTPRGAARSGRVIIVGAEPVLTLDPEAGPELRLYGLAGRGYVVETRADLGGSRPWEFWQSVHLDGAFARVPLRVVGDTALFYRAYEAAGGTLRLRGRDGTRLSFEARVTAGRRYDVESSPRLPAQEPWSTLFELGPVDASVRTFEWTPDGDGTRFFRLKAR